MTALPSRESEELLREAVQAVLDIVADDESDVGEGGKVEIGSRAWRDAIQDLRTAMEGER